MNTSTTYLASIQRGPYAGYEVHVRDDDDPDVEVYYSEPAGGSGAVLIRATHWVFRIPSRKQLVIRHFRDATAGDRRRAESRPALMGRVFRMAETAGGVSRDKMRDGCWRYYACRGFEVDDPMIGLELEMMLDITSGASAS